ncbi:MAG: CRISPR-associated protein Csx15 [Caldilineaceae bacterium]
MILLNFAHPTTEEQRTQIQALTGQPIDRLVEIQPQFDSHRSLAEQTVELVDRAGLTPAEWQTQSLVIIPPGLSPAATCVLADVHGRMGYFPPVVYIRKKPDALLPLFEAAEVINLQALRDGARRGRG